MPGSFHDAEADVVRLTPLCFGEPEQEKRQKSCAVPHATSIYKRRANYIRRLGVLSHPSPSTSLLHSTVLISITAPFSCGHVPRSTNEPIQRSRRPRGSPTPRVASSSENSPATPCRRRAAARSFQMSRD